MRKPTLTIFYQFNPWEPTIGGIQTIIRSFIKYAPDSFEVRLVGTGTGGEKIGQWSEAVLEGKPLLFMPLFHLQNDNVRQKIPTSVRYTLALMKRSFESDFLHFHRLEPTLASHGWAGHKTLFIHNDIHQQIQSGDRQKAILWSKFPWLYFGLERQLVRQFAQIFSCNSESASLYRQRYPEFAERVSFIRNTVDNEVFYPLTRTERDRQCQQFARQQNLPEDTRFILFAGRLHPQKDPLLLVQAMAQLKVSNAHLLIVGAGELAEQTRAEIEALGLSKRITMLGGVNQAQLANLHRLSSVFVLSSVYEGLPLVVLEALACGTPIVTTRAGETPNLLSENSGIVCPERTPIALAQALSQVLLCPERFPDSACVRSAHPFAAKTVIQGIYNQMYQQWEQRSPSLVSSIIP